MFRTNNIRGEKRFESLTQLKTAKPGFIKLTAKQLKLIENTDVLVLAEKLELLLVSLGNKLTTELYFKVEYALDLAEKLELPNQKNIRDIEELLQQLPFEFYIDRLPKKNRQTGHMQNFTWFQVSLNDAVSKFMQDYPDDMTEFEEGVLYGFPLTAIRAYVGLIESKHNTLNPATYYLAGVSSTDFWEDEQTYYLLWWNRLKKLSPTLIAEAEAKFYNKQ